MSHVLFSCRQTQLDSYRLTDRAQYRAAELITILLIDGGGEQTGLNALIGLESAVFI
jgi:hypothetical protein